MQQPPPSTHDELYLRTHSRRYALLLELAQELSPQRMLVVGPSYESVLLRDAAGAKVDTLGWADHRFPRVDGERHVQHDLNETEYPALDGYDLIVCAEVIEHLHVPAGLVIQRLAHALVPGGRLVVQTPNAAGLPKRLRLLRGRNPYEPLRPEPGNPGHFREYTIRELREAVEGAGLTVERVIAANYFDHGSRRNRAFRAVERVLPRTLRNGITLVAKRSPDAQLRPPSR